MRLAFAFLLRRAVTALAATALPSCSERGAEAAAPVDSTAGSTAPVQLVAREVVSGLDAPLFLTSPPGDARLFILEQPGRIRIVSGGRLLPTPFLDIAAKLTSGGERGLLGLAFHPRYAQNGQFYVNYTDRNGDTRVERYRVSADRDRADAASASLVLTVAQPFANHNGGMLAFGPDGKLYVGMGDGGSAGDPQGNGQKLSTLLGKLLRLDVDDVPNGAAYSVPADNPFVSASGARGEIWAFGLRNPWRFSFDPPSSRLYIADVGQGRLEEVDVAGVREAGVNYGWNRMEGSDCYNGASCDRSQLRLPVAEYGHDQGCSITGGYVYRGAIAALRGHYFYSDYCSGFLRSLRVADDGSVADRQTWNVGALGNVTSFGVDAAGELYVVSQNGKVYKLETR
ncbi:glucose/sorbosone dehydrogenase [Gemmatirosa kalamazoonensis]|uniref:Glucose/sorbosone dehydrogenase n=1 Tax=Gemmatirosa kalamazoonensis TaxID=861299 RepID=W0RHZ7_9BACT|nr:PQQ-dependent sugar dehydrogenase [Gemmatirosa kalamazoonensis]AHG90401.1 glucose/sorbosone dehydrogenase [Gemmatirosa kalamazoonensis]